MPASASFRIDTMSRFSRFGLALLAAAALAGAGVTAQAAPSYDSCTGYIDKAPATITASGTWCVRKDLSLGLFASGAAITIAANNVTLDCNGHRIYAFIQNNPTTADGVRAQDRLNVTVRNCRIRSFQRGIALTGAAGGAHTVEDNETHENYSVGIWVEGDGSRVRRNRVIAIGSSSFAYGIRAFQDVDVLDNDLQQTWSNVIGYGITVDNSSATIARNRMSGVNHGIVETGGARVVIRDNQIVVRGLPGDTGVSCASALGRAERNLVLDATQAFINCSSQAGNTAAP